MLTAMKGMTWESPRGPISIDPRTRDIVQNIYIRKVENVLIVVLCPDRVADLGFSAGKR
jgi:hypothetical protein